MKKQESKFLKFHQNGEKKLSHIRLLLTFGIIYDIVTLHVGVKIRVPREICVQHELLYLVSLQSQNNDISVLVILY